MNFILSLATSILSYIKDIPYLLPIMAICFVFYVLVFIRKLFERS